MGIRAFISATPEICKPGLSWPASVMSMLPVPVSRAVMISEAAAMTPLQRQPPPRASPHNHEDIMYLHASLRLTACALQGRFGDLTWAVAHALVDDVIAVSDNEIVHAMRLCFERMKVCPQDCGEHHAEATRYWMMEYQAREALPPFALQQLSHAPARPSAAPAVFLVLATSSLHGQ